jgi:hypothetical protein
MEVLSDRGHHSSPDIHTSPDVWPWAIYAAFHAGTMTILRMTIHRKMSGGGRSMPDSMHKK